MLEVQTFGGAVFVGTAAAELFAEWQGSGPVGAWGVEIEGERGEFRAYAGRFSLKISFPRVSRRQGRG